MDEFLWADHSVDSQLHFVCYSWLNGASECLFDQLSKLVTKFFTISRFCWLFRSGEIFKWNYFLITLATLAVSVGTILWILTCLSMVCMHKLYIFIVFYPRMRRRVVLMSLTRALCTAGLAVYSSLYPGTMSYTVMASMFLSMYIPYILVHWNFILLCCNMNFGIVRLVQNQHFIHF